MKLPDWWPRTRSRLVAVVLGTVAVLAATFTLLAASSFSPLASQTDNAGPSAQSAANATSGPGATPPAQARAETTPLIGVKLTEGTLKQWGRLKLGAEGFAPNEEVLVAALREGDGQPIELGRKTADGSGKLSEFGADLPDAVNSGTWTITTTGLTSHRQGRETLYVRSLEHFAVLSSYTPRPSEKLGFVAGGFEPDADVKVYLGPSSGQPIATVRADRAGNTAWSEVSTPITKPGEYELTFVGQGETDRFVQRITVSPLTPELELSPWSGPPGSKLELNGRGFLAGEKVQVFLGRSTQAASTFETDQYGNYWGIGPLVVPTDAGDGKLDVRLVGEKSGAEIVQGFAVVGVKPWAELSAYSGMPGTQISFSGGGFASLEDVTVHLGNANGQIVGTAQTDEAGNVLMSSSTAVQLPDAGTTEPTDVTFTLVGEKSRGEASAVFTVIPLTRPPTPNAERPRMPQPVAP